MAVLIDAGILIEAERGRLDLEPHVARRADDESFLSVITASELLHGVHRAARPEQRARRSAFVEGVLERFPLLPVDLVTARAHARVWAELAKAGTLIGPHDLWLAATCIAHGLTMVTANLREFRRVPGLEVEGWGD
jgi:predicted nucleic acid-binding protein